MLFLLAQVVFYWEVRVVRQHSWIGLFATKWAILHLEILVCRKYYFQKRIQCSHGSSVLEAAVSDKGGSLWGDISVSSIQHNKNIWNKLSLSRPWKFWGAGLTAIQLNSIFTGNNVLDAPAPNIDGFLLGDICVSSSQLNRPGWNKESLSPPWKPTLHDLFLSKTISILTGKQCARCFCFNTDWSPSKDTCFSST